MPKTPESQPIPPPATKGPTKFVCGFWGGGGNSKISCTEATTKNKATKPCKVSLSICPAVIPPKADPIIILGVTTLINFQSTASFMLWEKVEAIELKNFDTKEIIQKEADELIFLFGLNKKLGPILDWELELANKKIAVNTENFQTNKSGIFAVGDINDYPGKLDLILCGFHETTLAVQEAFRRINPGERVPFGYTTSNTKLQRKLGVAD